MSDWFTVTPIDANTIAISEWGHWEKVHSFLLIGTDSALLIDTGLGIGSLKKVVDTYTDLPIIVCTTHIHTDHIGGHHEFCTHYVHEAEVDWLENGIPGRSLEDVKRDVIRDCTKPLPEEFRIENYTIYTGPASLVLQDQDVIQLGNREVQVLHTPGHSPGHLCIFEKQTGYLFTGDLLYVEAPIYAFYPSTSPSDLMNSLERISQLENVHKIYGSHNKLGLNPSIFVEVQEAIDYIRTNDLAKFGTGIHRFSKIAFQF
ncbi:MAG: MBL fold metallo-hydrolase [Kurthia sp.]|nr:MBL fold metallo-hydrolase [Candidatus Kurthia equi]